MYQCLSMLKRRPLSDLLEDELDDVEQERVHDPEVCGEDEDREHHDGGRPLDLLLRRKGRPLQLPADVREESFRPVHPFHLALTPSAFPCPCASSRFRSPAAPAGQEGFEPPTSGFGDRRSSRSSYWPSSGFPGGRYFVSLWAVCARHQRQNRLNSSFSVVFLRFLVPT